MTDIQTPRRRSLLKGAALAAGAGALSAPILAQLSLPNRPIKMIVGLSAGGPSDLLARTIARTIQDKLGTNIIVENKVGAGGILAAAEVARQPADGSTVLFAAMPAIVFVPLLNRKLPYDQDRDFVPVGSVAEYTLFLFVSSELRVGNVSELIKLAREKPGTLTFASGGVGTSNHLAGELLKSMVGIDIRHVPYKGNAAAYPDVIAGRVSMIFDFLSTTQQFVDTGKLKLIATTGSSRSIFTRSTPTLDESGVKGFDITAWFGLFVRAETPKPVIDKINAALRSTLLEPEVRSALNAQGVDVASGSMQELELQIKKDQKLWGPIIRQLNIQVE